MNTTSSRTRLLPMSLAMLIVASTCSQVVANVHFQQKTVEELEQEDLDAIQGEWERPLLDKQNIVVGRAVKAIAGTTETVTYSDRQGNVLSSHRATISVKRLGPVRLFLYKDGIYTAGPRKGQKQAGQGAYIYKVRADRFIEIQGMLVGQEQLQTEQRTWSKVPQKDV